MAGQIAEGRMFSGLMAHLIEKAWL